MKPHPHTQAVKLAAGRMERVIGRFGDGPAFMSDRSRLAQTREDHAKTREWLRQVPHEIVRHLAKDS